MKVQFVGHNRCFAGVLLAKMLLLQDIFYNKSPHILAEPAQTTL
jgi:hypothetical protein